MDMEVDASDVRLAIINNRWSLRKEVDTLIKDILEHSFSELEEQPILFFPSKEEYGDHQCDNVLSIWTQLGEKPEESRQKYPHIKKPTDIGEEIKKHLEKRDDMIKEASIHDVGFVTFTLSGKWMVKECFSIEERDGDVTISVGPEGERKPFIRGKKDGGFGNASKDLSNLWYGLECEKATWIVNVIPVQQQEYYEMCFSAARQAGWLPEDRYESPSASYAGYQTCSKEVEQLIMCLQQMQMESVELPTTLLDNALGCTLLKAHRLVHCILDPVEMVKTEGNTIQHLLETQANIRSFTTKSCEDMDELKKASELTLGEGVERVLGLHLLMFSEDLKESCASILPHILYEYLHDLYEKFERYHKSVCEAGVVVEPTRLLLYEATAVVMEKCFHLLGINSESSSQEGSIAQSLLALSSAKRPMDVNASVADAESDNKKQKRVVGGAPDDSAITRLLIPVAARDAPKNPQFPKYPRLEPFSISLNITTDLELKKGKLLGHISVSDNIGLLSNAWVETFEPECGLVTIFNRDWCDSEDIINLGYLYFGNIISRQSIPFSNYMEICMKLYVTNGKDVVYQLCDHESDISFSKFWEKDIDSTCCAIRVKGEDGYVMMHYILLKDAVDAAIELTCTSLDDNLKVYGRIFAYYGNNFDYQCEPEFLSFQRNFYMALLYEDYTSSISSGAIIPLRKSLMAVPNKGGSLVIKFKLEDESGNEILSQCCEMPSQTRDSTVTTLNGPGCSFRIKVVWSQGEGCDKVGSYLL